MKTNEALKTKKVEQAFSASLVVVLLLILPLWGGTATLIGSVIGLIAYFVLFGERLRSRGQLRLAAIATAVGAVVAFALSLILGHWH